MTLTVPTHLPFVTQDEDATVYFAEGHVDPWRFFVAVLSDLAENCGSIEVMEMLGGEYYNTDRNSRIEEWIKEVRHVYYRMSPTESERMDPCEATDEGALAYTVISI